MRLNEVNKPLIAKAFKYGMSIEDLATMLNVKPVVIEEIIRQEARKTP